MGSLEPRKNHRRLLEAYARSGSSLPLVLAGGKGWLMDDFMGPGERPAGVVLTGYVADSELEWLYRNCFGFVYPSLFEGFGMPVLEALSLGAPVICSNTTSLPEVAGEAGLLVDPLDAGAIAAAMARLASRGDRTGGFTRRGIAPGAAFFWEASVRSCWGCMRSAGVEGRGFERQPPFSTDPQGKTVRLQRLYRFYL